MLSLLLNDVSSKINGIIVPFVGSRIVFVFQARNQVVDQGRQRVIKAPRSLITHERIFECREEEVA